MIKEEYKTVFDIKSQAIVNTVNSLGISGKGLALEFKKRYPENYKEYKKHCELEFPKGGDIFMTTTKYIHPRYIINFFTKESWRNPSKIEWIEIGLIKLKKYIINHKILSINIPLLGCNNGGLNKNDVIKLIYDNLSDAENCIINICHGI